MSWLKRSVVAVRRNDPATRMALEILLTYPGLYAPFWHRLSHLLYRRQLSLLVRIHVQFWRFVTGVEIHPRATIREGVFIDHGTDTMIGETTEIEEDAVLFHGVTLGGIGRDTGKRRPTVRKGVMISARVQILGPAVADERPKIGADVVVTSDIPVDATVVGVPTKVVRLNRKKVKKGHN